MNSTLSRPLRLAGLYLLSGIAWILFSDLLLQALGLPPAAQTFKGLIFVVLGSLLFLALGRHQQRVQQRLHRGPGRSASATERPCAIWAASNARAICSAARWAPCNWPTGHWPRSDQQSVG